MFYFEEKIDPSNTNENIASDCLSTQMADGEGISPLSFPLSSKKWSPLVVQKIDHSLGHALQRN